MISNINKSILELDPEIYICHQCNCESVRALGLAKAIFDKYPAADIYSYNYLVSRIPGTIIIRGNVINMLAQITPGKPNDTYDSPKKRIRFFKACLNEIAKYFSKMRQSSHTIAFPWGIGCGLAGTPGGNASASEGWKIYEKEIQNFAENNPSLNIIICEYNK